MRVVIVKSIRPCLYLHNVRKGLPLPSSLQSALCCHQVQQLHLITTAWIELDKEPLEDALCLIAEYGAQDTKAGCSILTQLPQQLTAKNINTGKKKTLERPWLLFQSAWMDGVGAQPWLFNPDCSDAGSSRKATVLLRTFSDAETSPDLYNPTSEVYRALPGLPGFVPWHCQIWDLI